MSVVIFRRCPIFLSSAVQSLSGSSFSQLDSAEDTREAMPFSAIPGPTPVPFLGNTLEMRKNLERMRPYYQDYFDKYGSIFKLKVLGSNYVVVLKDPTAIETVLRAEGKYPIRDTAMTKGLQWLYTNRGNAPVPLAFTSGEQWKALRSAASKQIMPKNVQKYHYDFARIVDRFTEYIKSVRDEKGNVRNIYPALQLLALELSAKTAYGSDWKVVANATAEDKEFIDAVGVIVGSISRVISQFPWYKIYPDKFSRAFKQALETMQKRGNHEVEKIYELVAAGKSTEVPGLLEQWLREGKIDEKVAVYEAAGLFAAGVDTTSNQACFLLHEIAKNQDVQEKLFQEIQDVIGEDKLPSPQHLSQMPYMKGCIQESHRLHGTAGIISRIVLEDTVLLGYKIPAQTSLNYSIYSAGRDSSLFSNPLEFDPERWQRDKDKIHPYSVLPFGFGPRACYGKRFAELELRLILIQMVKNFKLTTDLDVMDTVERSVICPKGEVPVRFVDRE